MGNTYPVPTDGEPMPWGILTVKEQRIELTTLAHKAEANISGLARRFGVSRKTAYKWLKRDSTQEQSRRPHNSPKQTANQTEQQVLAVRDEHPAWGGRKIARILQREHGIHIAPAPSPPYYTATDASFTKTPMRHTTGSVSSIHTPTHCGRWISKAISPPTAAAATR